MVSFRFETFASELAGIQPHPKDDSSSGKWSHARVSEPNGCNLFSLNATEEYETADGLAHSTPYEIHTKYAIRPCSESGISNIKDWNFGRSVGQSVGRLVSRSVMGKSHECHAASSVSSPGPALPNLQPFWGWPAGRRRVEKGRPG